MPGSSPITIVASQIYDVTACDHRLALDATRERSERTPPDAGAALLFAAGERHEAEVAAGLGYPEVVAAPGDHDAAAAKTLELMRAGVAGIYQGVVRDGRFLARPDVLERVEGASALGGWHYVPGDVKSALAARTDAALQVGFAARLLESVQGVRPARGFLVLGDRRREEVDLDGVRLAVDEAIERAVDVVDGRVATRPFFSSACSRCRWRGTCLPLLSGRRDASLVFGMTRTLHRVLARHDVFSVEDLAGVDVEGLRRTGVPTDGLERLARQAKALVEGRAIGRRSVDCPRGDRREGYLRIECDPLDHGEPFLFSWGWGAARTGAVDAMPVRVVSDDAGRASVLDRVLSEFAALAVDGAPIYVYGRTTGRALDRLADRLSLEPARAGDLEGRLVDLAPWVRRAAALPVFRYALDEVAAFVDGRPLPPPDAPDDDLFVAFAGLRDGGVVDAERPAVEAFITSRGRAALVALASIRRWLG